MTAILKQTTELPEGAMLDAAETAAIIKSHVPYDAVGAYYQQLCLDLISATPHFANRYHYTPAHFTSQAVVVCPAAKSIALLHHKKLDIWVGFGGHVEPADKNLIATAYREAAEEAGLTPAKMKLVSAAPFDIDVHGFPARKDQPDHLHFDIRFLFECETEVPLIGNEESMDLRWVPLAELRRYMPPYVSNNRQNKMLEETYL